MLKLAEHTNGNHIYMRLVLDNKAVEEVDVYFQKDGSFKYVTSADHGRELDPKAHDTRRNEIIQAFNALY